MNEKAIINSIHAVCQYLEQDTEAFLKFKDKEHMAELAKDRKIVNGLIDAMYLMVGEVAE